MNKQCYECIYWQPTHNNWGICTHEKVMTGYYMRKGRKMKHTNARYKNNIACHRRFVERNEMATKSEMFIRDCSCGGVTKVTNSRPTDNGHITRRRECMECGARFSTIEVPLKKYKEMKKQNLLFEKLNDVFMKGEK